MQNKRGFTLIELIVAMAVAAVFIICVIALISPSTKIFNRVEDSADAKLLTESLLEEIRSDANLSGALNAGEKDENGNGTVQADDITISVNDEGYLVKTKNGESQLLFDPKFYKNKTVTMETAQSGENCVDMTLSVFSGDRQIYTLKSQLKPVLDVASMYDKNTPEGMLALARGEIALNATYKQYGYEGKGQRHDGIIRMLQWDGKYYNGHFPEYDIGNILSRDKLQETYGSTKDSGLKNGCNLWLTEKMYLCCFIAKTTLVPIVYLTSESHYTKLIKDQTHTAAVAIYWEKIWYVKPNLQGSYMLPSFNGKEADAVLGILKANGWIPALSALK